ncbi:MAG TPA: YfiR family protein [Lacunisphaera sp.]
MSSGLTGRCGAWLAVLAFVFGCGAAGHAQPASSREYQIKAVFLFNFAQFVEWPADAFPEANSPLVIGVLGEDPFGQALDETVHGEQVGSRPLLIQRWRRIEDVGPCHILYISTSEQSRRDKIIAQLNARSTLTVSDSEDFARHGGMIRFFTDHNRIRLQINLEAVRAARLTISSKLLRPAEIVAGNGGVP